MALNGYIDYQRREFCKDVKCRRQIQLESEPEGSEQYEKIREICKSACEHTTYEFHHWLIDKNYLIMRPAVR